MSLTLEQRRDINRQNSKKSTGPKTKEGKANARKNAMKHGLRAKILALPNEDPAKIAERAEFWNDYYKPRSPAAHHLVNECVQATILSDRVHQFHHFALSKQIRSAGKACELAREKEVNGLNSLMNDDPCEGVRLLKRSGYGIRSLITRWEALRRCFEADGNLTGAECDQASMLLGCPPTLEDMKQNPDAYLLCLFNAMSNNEALESIVRMLCDPRNVPPSLQRKIEKVSSRPPEDCRTWIKNLFTRELGMLRELAESFEEDERLDLIESEDRALILQEETDARLFLRYHAESRNAFHRAFNKLEKTLESDAAQIEDGAPNEPDEEPLANFEAEAPNEPEPREWSEFDTETETPNEADFETNVADRDAGLLGKMKPVLVGCLLILLLFSARFASASLSPNEADPRREVVIAVHEAKVSPIGGSCPRVSSREGTVHHQNSRFGKEIRMGSGPRFHAASSACRVEPRVAGHAYAASAKHPAQLSVSIVFQILSKRANASLPLLAVPPVEGDLLA